MRLIDADALIENIKKSAESKKEVISGIVLEVCDMTHRHIIEIAEIQPTAYDVEKVISDLEREKMIICGCHMIETNVIRIDDAIEIVRKGGMNG
ncbi:MAG: hypothetical protein IJZ23_07015 [Roseburia sp.]|nr:hypothetical protein [Roseburia sp.]MBQ8279576.1 hypothetical protein [Roseburia sp.]